MVVKPTPAGVEIDVRLIPRSAKNELAGSRDGRLLVRVTAPPVDGAANDALIRLIADLFAVPRRAVCIVAGERSRHKRVGIDGITEERARSKLAGG
jgi:uncharacterized protein (TIGR00251 family)